MIYIGYDPTQDIAYNVCEFSVTDNSDIPVRKLFSGDIPEYERNFGEPQSTDFTFTRFLVPYLSDFKGYSIFCDCDFLFLHDPKELIEIAKKAPELAVHVVQHPPYTPHSDVKMDGRPQHSAFRKNWASLIVFNNSHPDCRRLTPEFIKTHPRGRDFHELRWTSDDAIGSLPLEWNCLDNYYHLETPKAIHYTDGGPWLGHYHTRYAPTWITAKQKYLAKSLKSKE
jgi:hypothetical protein